MTNKTGTDQADSVPEISLPPLDGEGPEPTVPETDKAMEENLSGSSTHEGSSSHGTTDPGIETASETTHEGTGVESLRRTPKTKPKWLWIMGAFAILVGYSLFTLLSVEAQPDYISVKEAVTNPSPYLGKKIQISGTVEDWNPTAEDNRFILNETYEDTTNFYTILIDANNATIPSTFGENKGSTILGVLMQFNGTQLKLIAQDIKVGCPSKYEADA